MEKRYLSVEDLSAYVRSFRLSNYIWQIVTGWDYLAKKTIGLQLIRSIDSISANIAEGFHRFHKNDKIHFYYYSKGSVGESIDWVKKANIRKLFDTKQFTYIMDELKDFPLEINSLIRFTKEKLKK